MITDLFINFVVLIITAIFSWAPIVTALPTIYGFNIDGAFVTGMGEVNVFLQSFWPELIMFQGFLFLLGYYAIKMVLKFFLGHRAPGQ